MQTYRISRILVSPNVQIFGPADTAIQEKMDEGHTNLVRQKQISLIAAHLF